MTFSLEGTDDVGDIESLTVYGTDQKEELPASRSGLTFPPEQRFGKTMPPAATITFRGERALSAEPPVSTRIDLRNYGIGAQILRDLGVKKMRLMAVPRRMPSMAGFDLEVVGHAQPPKDVKGAKA